jgi:general secretion pathway protein D
MKTISKLRFSATLLVIFAMLSPAAVLALGDGKKHFKEGSKQEAVEAWDRAAEEFAMAVNESPKNPEYRLHLQRALFMASQMYIKKGTAAANEKDYEGGYNSFRKAYAYDPTNELAKSEMERMIRLQSSVDNPAKDDKGNLKLVQTSYKKVSNPMPQKLEKLRDVPFPGGVNLQFLVKELAKDLDLNVLFDTDSRLESRQVKIDLRNVSAAQALDYIFLQENLFFQKVGPRTILVATGTRRANFQQLVLRTFYLQNADPTKIKPLIQQAIPAQPGRSQTIVMEDAATNSITIRDTAENIRLIGQLIASLDKDRAEVVMDVAIYEVNKSDLLQFGNQFGNLSQLLNLGGFGLPFLNLGSTQPITQGIPGSTGIHQASLALGLPISNFQALSSRQNTKLLASTQIHAFNNEDSSATIGQRVPVRTAQVQTGNAVGGGGIVSDIINYEQVGLTLHFKPLVFPNQDVQVAMEIQSKDVAGGGTADNPVFTERTIKGTARVQNNKTLLLASVAQNVETKGNTGLPLVGLLPIIGRLFTSPTRDNRQIDIVIAITPRVIRAPSILPEDEVERSTGSQATPTNSSLEAMIIQDEIDDQMAAARRNPTNTTVQMPDQPADPAFVRTSAVQPDANNATAAVNSNPASVTNDPPLLKQIDTSVNPLDLAKTSDTSVQKLTTQQPRAMLQPVGDTTVSKSAAPKAGFKFGSEFPEMKAGEKIKIPVNVYGTIPFRSVLLGLKFDPKQVAVRSVQFGDVFGKLANTAATPFLNQDGTMRVNLLAGSEAADETSGVIAYVEIEALVDGKPAISFEKDVLNVMTVDGKNFVISF